MANFIQKLLVLAKYCVYFLIGSWTGFKDFVKPNKCTNKFKLGYTYDTKGRELTYKNSAGYWREYTRDTEGRELSSKDSTGYRCEYTRDTEGRELSYKSSTGCWRECTRDSNGRELSYKDNTGYWYEYTYDTNGRELSYKTKDFDGIRIADDGSYVLHYDNTNDVFLAGCSGILTRAQAIKSWNRDDNRAKLYTLTIGVSGI